MTVDIRLASDLDWPALWPIWHAIVVARETYMWEASTTSEHARRLWLPGPPAETWIAEDDGTALGTYLLKPNQPGPGAHVANAAFMVAPTAHGRGIGRAMAEHCLDRARGCGYLAMQFNAVVASNTGAIALWKSLGFTTVGTVPGAYDHRTLGLVDIHIMHRAL